MTTPWRVEDYDGDDWTCDYTVKDAEGGWLWVGPGCRHPAGGREDAERAVRLVNAEPEIVAALEAAESVLVALLPDPDDRVVVARVRAALAKVRP